MITDDFEKLSTLVYKMGEHLEKKDPPMYDYYLKMAGVLLDTEDNFKHFIAGTICMIQASELESKKKSSHECGAV